MIKFIRRNTIALIALFIALGGTAYAANTVRSADIVDGTIKTVDLANNAVTPPKASGLWHTELSTSSETWRCAAQAQTWTACATRTLTVPAGHFYTVTVTSYVTANPGANPVNLAWCPASTGPTCLRGNYEWLTLAKNEYRNASTTLTNIYGPGNVTFSTALYASSALPAMSNAYTVTSVSYLDHANDYAH